MNEQFEEDIKALDKAFLALGIDVMELEED